MSKAAQQTPANPREVSKVLKAAGHTPRHGEKMHGRGGFQASAEYDGSVRVTWRPGPETDHLTEEQIGAERARLHDTYAAVLAAAGYPVQERAGGTSPAVWGRDTSRDTRPTLANVRAALTASGVRLAGRRKADSSVVAGLAVSTYGTGSCSVAWEGPADREEDNLAYARNVLTRPGWLVSRESTGLVIRPIPAAPRKAPAKAVVHLAIELPDLEGWAREQGLDPEDEASILEGLRTAVLDAVKANAPLPAGAGVEATLTAD